MDRRFIMEMLRDWGIALLVAFAALLVWSFFTPSSVKTGADAPTFALTDVRTDETVDLEDFAGRIVVVNFWATWCGPCVAEIPELSRFAVDHPSVAVVGISVDDKPRPQVAAWVRRKDMAYTVLHDPGGISQSAYGATALPTTYIVSADGHVVDAIVGGTTAARLARAVEKAKQHAH